VCLTLCIFGACADDVDSPESLAPASAAGISTDNGPGVPVDFHGGPAQPPTLSPQSALAIKDAQARQKAALAEHPNPIDRGFAPSPPTLSVKAGSK